MAGLGYSVQDCTTCGRHNGLVTGRLSLPCLPYVFTRHLHAALETAGTVRPPCQSHHTVMAVFTMDRPKQRSCRKVPCLNRYHHTPFMPSHPRRLHPSTRLHRFAANERQCSLVYVHPQFRVKHGSRARAPPPHASQIHDASYYLPCPPVDTEVW